MTGLKERLGNSRLWNTLLWPAGRMMGSRLRQKLFDPLRTLNGAGLAPGDIVLEIGCGTGFFTIPAARMVGDAGTIIAMDLMAGYLQEVEKRVAAAGLNNVRILKRDALDTGLDDASVDKVLLFGVLPLPLTAALRPAAGDAPYPETGRRDGAVALPAAGSSLGACRDWPLRAVRKNRISKRRPQFQACLIKHTPPELGIPQQERKEIQRCLIRSIYISIEEESVVYPDTVDYKPIWDNSVGHSPAGHSSPEQYF